VATLGSAGQSEGQGYRLISFTETWDQTGDGDGQGKDFAPASRKYTSEPRRSILIACQATCSSLRFGQAPAALPGA
jgi:hypothetical protein